MNDTVAREKRRCPNCGGFDWYKTATGHPINIGFFVAIIACLILVGAGSSLAPLGFIGAIALSLGWVGWRGFMPLECRICGYVQGDAAHDAALSNSAVPAMLANNVRPTLSQSLEDSVAEPPAAHQSRATKRCPDCAEDVLVDARICRYCRHEFATLSSNPETTPQTSPETAGHPMPMPTGNWSLGTRYVPKGTYQVVSGDTRMWWARDSIGQTVQLERRGDDEWMSFGTTGLLLKDYRWATSPDMNATYLLRDAAGKPLLLLRVVTTS